MQCFGQQRSKAILDRINISRITKMKRSCSLARLILVLSNRTVTMLFSNTLGIKLEGRINRFIIVDKEMNLQKHFGFSCKKFECSRNTAEYIRFKDWSMTSFNISTS